MFGLSPDESPTQTFKQNEFECLNLTVTVPALPLAPVFATHTFPDPSIARPFGLYMYGPVYPFAPPVLPMGNPEGLHSGTLS